MAPAGESVYFPPLDKCFTGEVRLLSWKTVLTSLLHGSGGRPASAFLLRFLEDEQTISILRRPFSPFLGPTPQTKSAFETKTSAANVTPSSEGTYNVDEIKNDSLWLSKEAKIDEVSALRVTLIEWQSRPAAELLQGFPEDLIAANEQLPTTGFLPASTTGSMLVGGGSDESTNAFFYSLEGRRQRLLEHYISECWSVLKVSEVLVRLSLWGNSASESDANEDRIASSLKPVADRVYEPDEIRNSSGPTGKVFVEDCIENMHVRISRLEKGSGWYKDDGGNLSVERQWGEAQILELIHLMQIVLIVLDSSDDLTLSSTVSAWFGFAGKYQFLDGLTLPFPEQEPLIGPIQSLTAIISLLVLKLPAAFAYSEAMGGDGVNSNGTSPRRLYLEDLDLISEITSTLITAAPLPTASLALFGWSMILQIIRDIVMARKEAHELRQSHSAAARYVASGESSGERRDSFGGPQLNNESASRRSSTNELLPESHFDKVLDVVMRTAIGDDPIAFLAKSAVDEVHVFDVISTVSEGVTRFFSGERDENQMALRPRKALLDLVRASLDWVEYGTPILAALLSILTGGATYWDHLVQSQSPSASELIRMFFEDQVLVQKILQTAVFRFPFEALPFLELCKALAASRFVTDDGKTLTTQFFGKLSSFTQVLPTGFGAYETTREDENANYIVLRTNLRIFVPWKSNTLLQTPRISPKGTLELLDENSSDDILSISAGTVGRIISESRPPVAIWYHAYSGFKYCGKILESALAGASFVDYAFGREPDPEILADIIGLLTASLTSLAARENISANESALAILEEASDGLSRNRDIVSIIFELFEVQLQAQQGQSAGASTIDLLVKCLHFIEALLAVLPGRVWPLLARTELLEFGGRGGKLSSILASTEMVTGQFDFLLGSVHLFETLIENAVSHAIIRKATTKAVARYAKPESLSSGIPDNVMGNILLAFERTLVEVFESMPSWRFASLDERLEINQRLLFTFQNILRYVYGIDDRENIREKVTGVLAPAAEYLLAVYLSPAANDIHIQPLLRILSDGQTTRASTLSMLSLKRSISQVQANLNLCIYLLRVGFKLQQVNSYLERQLFKVAPVIARLFVAHDSYRLPVVALFEAMIRNASTTDGEPPSLLGYLGPRTAKTFLSVVCNSQLSTDTDDDTVDIWNFLSTAVSHRQQWLAICLLTGGAPRKSPQFKKIESSFPRGKLALTVVLDSLSNIEALQPQQALAMLEFVSLAEDYWPWAMTGIAKHPRFLAAISHYVGGLTIDHDTRDQQQHIQSSYKIRMASYIAEILAMYIHSSRQLGRTTFVKDIVKNLSYFTNNAVKVVGYNSSLHGNLKKNFEMKFPGFDLLMFKQTSLERRHFGPDYFYSTDICKQVLGFDKSWAGKKGQGFSEEIQRANINLSVIESQVLLLRSWTLLASELTNILSEDTELQVSLAQVVNDSLRANSENTLPDHIFARLEQVRAEFALELMQRLVDSGCINQEVKDVLPTVWNSIRSSGCSFDAPQDGSGLEYYRTLLRILFLALRAYCLSPLNGGSSTNKKSPKAEQSVFQLTPSVQQMLLDMTNIVIGQGFRLLATQLHESPETSSPADIAVITGLLQTLLQIPGVAQIQPQIVSCLSDNGVGRYATTLFSWSHHLRVGDTKDPIYGELSILFLLELSTMPMMAHLLAVDGIFSHLSAAALTDYFRQSAGVGPFAEAALDQRLYSIWTRGFLPLCLNLLDAIGAPLASEIAAFLGQFPEQLSRASQGFNDKAPISASASAMSGYITLSMASEAHSLALITFILDAFRAAGPSAGVVSEDIAVLGWDKTQIREDIESWLSTRQALRERIVAVTEREIEWAKMKSSGNATGQAPSENRLEEKVVRELEGALVCLRAENDMFG